VTVTTDTDAWDGDFDELPQWDEFLVDDAALCDRMFASKQEAYLAGRSVAARGPSATAPRGAESRASD
jgi:hypothetical protein